MVTRPIKNNVGKANTKVKKDVDPLSTTSLISRSSKIRSIITSEQTFDNIYNSITLS